MTISFDVRGLTVLAPNGLTLNGRPHQVDQNPDRNNTLERLKNKFISLTHLGVFLSITFACPVLAFKVNEDGTFSYTSDEILSRLNNVYETQGRASPHGEKPGDTIISISDEFTSWHLGCVFLIPGIPRTMDEIKANNFAYLHSQISSYSGRKVYGGPYCSNMYQKPIKNLFVDMWSSEVNSVGTSRAWSQFITIDGDNPGEPADPEKCSAVLTKGMNFGVLDGSGSATADARIEVKCSKDSAISVKVDSGNAFHDPDSGTEISFVTRGGSNNGSSIMLCQPDCSVSITGEMTSIPNNPGAYRWSVPVIVEYK